MKKETTKDALIQTLLFHGEMCDDLYDFELKEHIAYWKKGLKEDNEEFVFAVTEREGNVAMLLITKGNKLFVNEAAREKLILLWAKSYVSNITQMLPMMVHEISNEIISVTGVKTI